MQDLHFDTTSFVLCGLIITCLVLMIFLRAPAPQTHPFLLGRQSYAGRTRYPNESTVYMNSSSSGIRAPLRPDKQVKTLRDILDQSLAAFDGGARGTWVHGGEKIVTVVMELRAGLLSALGPGEGTVAVLVEDPTDALLVTLALALTPHRPYVIAPGSNLPKATEVTAIIQSANLFSAAKQLSTSPDAKWIELGGAGDDADELLVTGRAVLAEAAPIPEVQPTDVALTIVSEGVPLTFTHLNLTASLIAWLSLYPAAPRATRPSINDIILSYHHPSTPYGFGLALLAIYTSASLSLPTLPDEPNSHAVLASISSPSASPPTLLFAPSELLSQPLYRALLEGLLGDSQFMITQARDTKLRLLREGTVSQSTFWDTMVFGALRKKAGVHKLRQVVFQGEQARLEFYRIALGVPVVAALAHAFLLAPLSAGLMHDFQRLPPPWVGEADALTGGEVAHVGPPVAGVEVKLRGDEKDIAQGRIVGELLVRTPVLPAPDTLPSSLLLKDDTLPSLPPYPGRAAAAADEASPKWLRTGIRAEMGKEGVLWID